MSMRKSIGVLLSNIGSPDAPDAKAVKNYLRQFLSDPHVIPLSPLLWQPILHGIVLPLRSRKSARLYQKIWTDAGSPLLTLTQKQAQALHAQLTAEFPDVDFHMAVGMRYGKPSLEDALAQLKTRDPDQIFILPLYPQYSFSTTASTFAAVSKILRTWIYIPEMVFINHYYQDEAYINALATHLQCYWEKHGKNPHLLFSFHGLPKSLINAGDPYAQHCRETVRRVTEKLKLPPETWSIAFQSRFGPKEWLQPYCADLLRALPGQGIHNLDVICPGFAADCLETLEEIAITNKALFLQAGGQTFDYIPALNDTPTHIQALTTLIGHYLS